MAQSLRMDPDPYSPPLGSQDFRRLGSHPKKSHPRVAFFLESAGVLLGHDHAVNDVDHAVAGGNVRLGDVGVVNLDATHGGHG